MPDDDDRPRDASSAADPDWANVVVPDDISELAGEIEAYRRERRRAARQARLSRWSRRRGVVPLLVLTCAMVLAALIATMLTVLGPTALGRAPTPLPVAAHPAAAVGRVQGLLPDVALRTDTGVVHSRDLRPSVIALVPPRCNCGTELNTLSGEAFGVELPFSVVEPGTADPAMAAAVQRISRGAPTLYFDPDGTLARSEAATGVTVVMLNRDATIFRVVRSVTTANAGQLGPLLQTMVLPVAG
jgi:hypothetical protein